MRYADWMGKDERAPEQIKADREQHALYAEAAQKITLLCLQKRERELMDELEKLQVKIAQFPAKPA